MKKFLGYTLSVVGALVFALVLGVAQASPVVPFTGPAGTNPLDPPNILGGMNTMLNNLNAAISNGSTLGTNVGLFSNANFQIAGVSSGASNTGLSFGLIVPNPSTLGQTTIKFFLTFFDSLGRQSYIPVWQ